MAPEESEEKEEEWAGQREQLDNRGQGQEEKEEEAGEAEVPNAVAGAGGGEGGAEEAASGKGLLARAFSWLMGGRV